MNAFRPALLLTVLSAVPVGAVTLDGVQFEISHIATGFALQGQTYLTAPGSASFGKGFYVQLGSTSIQFGAVNGGTFRSTKDDGTPIPFNGFTIFDYANALPDFDFAHLTATLVTGSASVSFDANTISVNFSGAEIAAGLFATIELDPANVPATTVPLPASLPILLAGLGVLGMVSRTRD